MNEFLTSAFEMDRSVGALQALARMAGALLLGGLVAGIYRWTRQAGGRRHEVCVRTLPDFTAVDAVREAIERCARDVECLSFTQPKGGDGVQRTFEVTLREGHDLECIQAAVRAVAGVTAVEVRRG
jgi:hypothetical protein